MSNVIAIGNMIGNGSGLSATINNITPISVKGGVIRNIDQATGDIARTTNGWIEDEKYGWFATQYAAAWSAEFDSAEARTGRLTVKLSTTDTTGRVRASHSLNSGASNTTAARSKYEIPLKPSTPYKLSCFVKTNNVAANSVFVTIFLQNVSYVYTQAATTNKLSGNNDWTEVTASFTTGSTIVTGRIELFNDVAGNISDAWFDINSMTLEEVSTITNPLSYAVNFYPKGTAVSSTDNIDQSQVNSITTGTFGQDTNSKIAQQIIPTKKNMTGFVIRRGVDTGTFTGDITFSIQADSGSTTPSGTDLGTPVTITNAQWGAISLDTDYAISYPLTLDLTKTYWIVWTPSTVDANNYTRYRVSDTNNPYAGAFKLYTTSTTTWSGASSRDLYFKTLYSKNTTNMTVRTDTETLSVTAPTVEGWENGTVIDTKALGLSPITLAPGDNTVYLSSNGSPLADSDTDESLQVTVGGTYLS
jgi:hypothetical protein